MSWAQTKTIWDRIESARSSLNTTLSGIASTLTGIATNASTAATKATAAATDAAAAKTNAANAQLSSARLGYIDRIANSTYGLDKIQALVATNNTAANNGTLSQKLSYIISNPVRVSPVTSGLVYGSVNNGSYSTTRVASGTGKGILNVSLPQTVSGSNNYFTVSIDDQSFSVTGTNFAFPIRYEFSKSWSLSFSSNVSSGTGTTVLYIVQYYS